MNPLRNHTEITYLFLFLTVNSSCQQQTWEIMLNFKSKQLIHDQAFNGTMKEVPYCNTKLNFFYLDTNAYVPITCECYILYIFTVLIRLNSHSWRSNCPSFCDTGIVVKKGRESEGYSTREYACISHTSIPGIDNVLLLLYNILQSYLDKHLTSIPFLHKQLKGQGHEKDFKSFCKN